MFRPSFQRLQSRGVMTATSPFSRAVVNAMRRLYPESLADKSFDNTGLLLEAPFDPIRRQMNSAMLTIDLTKAVADEAIERNDSVVIAYHPIIFRGLKSITLGDTQQRTLLRLAAEGISVYSPHTAVDCAPGGIGDWLADIITGTPTNVPQIQSGETSAKEPSSPTQEQPSTPSPKSPVEKDDPFLSAPGPKRPTYMLQHHPSQISLPDQQPDRALQLSASKHTREPITPSTVKGYEDTGAGMGRVVHFATPQSLLSIIDRIGLGLGNPKGFPIAIPQGKTIEEMQISSVAICAGSGGGVFGGLEEDVDLYFTGEMSHHEALAAIERGKCVITLFHSNTERGFLSSVMKGQLDAAIRQEWDKVRKEEQGTDQEELAEVLGDDSVEVHVSEADRDPYGIVINKDELE